MSFLGKLTRLFGQEDAPTPAEKEWLAHVVEMTDHRIASVPTYQDVLSPAIDLALAYFEQTLALIPGTVAMDSANPLLPQLFPHPEDLSASLGRSLAVKQELPALMEEGHTRLYALLGMRTKISPEDGQPYLTDHTIRALSPNPAAVRQNLQDAAFDSLLQGFANENLHYQKKLELAQTQKELLKEARAQAGRKTDYSGVSQSLDAHISRASQDLSADKVLQNLKEWIQTPENCMRLCNRSGHALRPTPEQETADALHLPLMATQDRRQWLVCLVEFPVPLARDALAAENHNHRFILI